MIYMNTLKTKDSNTQPKIILASASPRRKELLKLIVDHFEIIPTNIEETYPDSLDKFSVSLHISKLKAQYIHAKYPHDIVIGCDTTIVFNDKIIGKPLNKEDARKTLLSFSNKTHHVVTSVTVLYESDIYQINSINKIYFKKLSSQDINSYLEKDEYQDKAGSYAIQGLANKFIEKYDGEYEAIVGLPLKELSLILTKLNNTK